MDHRHLISGIINCNIKAEMTVAKEISILGAAKSGIGAAMLAKKVGYNVFVSDIDVISDDVKKKLTNKTHTEI